MGNCLVHHDQDKLVKIMKMDGKILEYQTPLKVHQVLLEFTGHSISDTLPAHHHLHPDTQMLHGHLYYLLPPAHVEKKALKVSNQTSKAENGTSVVRVKLVITKQELMKMLAHGGVSVEEVESSAKSHRKDFEEMKSSSTSKAYHKDLEIAKRIMYLHSILSRATSSGKGNENGKGWKPALESIPE